MTSTPHISIVGYLQCNYIITGHRFHYNLIWHFITVIFAVLTLGVPRDVIEVKHGGQGSLRATLLHWGCVEGPLDSLTGQVTGKHGRWKKRVIELLWHGQADYWLLILYTLATARLLTVKAVSDLVICDPAQILHKHWGKYDHKAISPSDSCWDIPECRPGCWITSMTMKAGYDRYHRWHVPIEVTTAPLGEHGENTFNSLIQPTQPPAATQAKLYKRTVASGLSSSHQHTVELQGSWRLLSAGPMFLVPVIVFNFPANSPSKGADCSTQAKASPRGDDRKTTFTQIQVAASALWSDHKKGLEISAVDFGRRTKTVQLSRDHK